MANRKALSGWVKSQWKVKGHVDLKLGSKGFFTTIFYNMSDQDQVFEESPYFFNSTSLHLHYWIVIFSP
jgi:hypothetical protein